MRPPQVSMPSVAPSWCFDTSRLLYLDIRSESLFFQYAFSTSLSECRIFGEKASCKRTGEGSRCHPERSEGSLRPKARPFASLRVTGRISTYLPVCRIAHTYWYILI